MKAQCGFPRDGRGPYYFFTQTPPPSNQITIRTICELSAKYSHGHFLKAKIGSSFVLRGRSWISRAVVKSELTHRRAGFSRNPEACQRLGSIERARTLFMFGRK